MSEIATAPTAERSQIAIENFVAHAAPLPAGVRVIDGKQYIQNSKGDWTPYELVKPQHKLEDEIVRKILGFAKDLSAQISRFKGHTFEDLSDFDGMLAQEYQATKGGTKGNRTYTSVDGLMKVEVRMADLIDFGPELQQAKTLIDECLKEWAASGNAEIRGLVMRVFNVEKEGQINKAELFALMRYEVADPRWQNAMQAIRDAIRVTGAKQYFRFYERASQNDKFQIVSIDLAQA